MGHFDSSYRPAQFAKLAHPSSKGGKVETIECLNWPNLIPN